MQMGGLRNTRPNSQFISAAAMWRQRSPSKKKTATKLRSWRAPNLRSRAHYLGTVEAPDERAAEAAAVAQFDHDQEQRKRLVVLE
jgi:hypothetical protein